MIASVFISRLVPVFAARSTVFSRKLERHRKLVLMKVRQRLALITIKRHWKALRLSFKAMQIKIIKYKRKIDAVSKRKALFSRYTAVSPRSIIEPTPTTERHFSNIAFSVSEMFAPESGSTSMVRVSALTDHISNDIPKSLEKQASLLPSRYDSDDEVMLEEQLKREAREQMLLKKVAHSIPDYSEKLPLPCLQERAIHTSGFSHSPVISPVSRVLRPTIAFSGRMKQAERTGVTGPFVRSYLIQSPPTAPCRFRPGHVNMALPLTLSMPKDVKYEASYVRSLSVSRHSEEPSYMRATTASKAERWVNREPVRNIKRSPLGKIDLKKVSQPTFSFEMKMKEPVLDQGYNLDRKEPWRPSVPKSPQYTPALENSFYKPYRLPRVHLNRLKTDLASPRVN